MSEEVKFDFNEDIIYQIEMMSYMNYNDKLCSINEHLGEIYGYQDLNDTEQAQLQYEKDLSYKAIKQLQDQLQQKENIIKGLDNTIQNLEEVMKQKENIIKEVREYIENNELYEQDYDYDYEENLVVGPPSDETTRKILLEILEKENK